MTRIDSTHVKWRVQLRASRSHVWKNAGLFETRSAARADAADIRYHLGFGNVRVVRHISGKGKAP